MKISAHSFLDHQLLLKNSIDKHIHNNQLKFAEPISGEAESRKIWVERHIIKPGFNHINIKILSEAEISKSFRQYGEQVDSNNMIELLVNCKARGMNLLSKIDLFSEGLIILAQRGEIGAFQAIIHEFPELTKISTKNLTSLIYAAIPWPYGNQYIENRAPQFILFFKENFENYGNISQENIHRLEYTIFTEKLVICRTPEKNRDAKKLIQLLFIDHPHADHSVKKLVSLMIQSHGNRDIIQFLKEVHPAYCELNSDHITKIMKSLTSSMEYPGCIDQKEYEKRAFLDKRESFYALLEQVDPVAWTSENICDVLSAIANCNCMIGFEQNEQIEIYEKFSSFPGWEELSPSQIERILKSATCLRDEGCSVFVFKKLQGHPNYLFLSKKQIVHVLNKLITTFQSYHDAEKEIAMIVDQFIDHSSWKEIGANELATLASDAYDLVLLKLSTHPNWKKVSTHELEYIFYTATLSIYSVELFTSLPSWKKLTKKALLNITLSQLNRLYGEPGAREALMLQISTHSAWSAFTKQDLLKIKNEMKVSGWKFSAEVGNIFTKHPNWPSAQKE